MPDPVPDLVTQCREFCKTCLSGDTCGPMMHDEPCYGLLADEIEALRHDIARYIQITTDQQQEIERLRTALDGLVKDCPDCGGKGIAYLMVDETEIGQAPGSSGQDCRRCAEGRAALSVCEAPDD